LRCPETVQKRWSIAPISAMEKQLADVATFLLWSCRKAGLSERLRELETD